MRKKILIIACDMPPAPHRERMAAAFAAQGVQLSWRGIAVQTNATGTACDAALQDLGILRSGMDAQQEGFDAVCVDTLNDIGTVALRSVLDIPVLGSGHSAMLHALTLGARFSVIVPSQAVAAHCRASVKQWGLERQCSSVRALAAEGSQPLQDRLRETARLCMAQDGADVICLGTSALAFAAADDDDGDGLAESLGIPMVEPLASACRLAETLLALKLSHSRTAHPRPMVPKPAVFRAMADAGATLAGSGTPPPPSPNSH